MSLRRHTPQRAVVLRIVKSGVTPLSTEEVRRRASRDGISRATVFRNLKLLCAQGEIAMVDAVDGMRRYIGHSAHEATFTCQRCGKVRRLTSRTLNGYVQRKMFGPQTIMTSRLMGYGVCTDCTKKLKRL